MSVARVTVGDPTRASDINDIIPLVVNKTTSFTITDTGGYYVFNCTPTAGSTQTFTLPTLSANTNRKLSFVHATTASGIVKVDGEGSEDVGLADYQYLRVKGDNLTIIATTTRWEII